MPLEDLQVWRRASRLSVELYRYFANHKDFGFRDQITRAGLSVPSNIAEGYERSSNRELLRFLTYAKGSIGELRTQIYIGAEIGYVDRDTAKRWNTEAQELSRMIRGLTRHFGSGKAN
jgi:four helix bundle protein